MPFPLQPGRAYTETWRFTPITKLDALVRVRVSGGGVLEEQKFEFGLNGASRRTQVRRLKAVAPKEPLDIQGLAIVEYDMQDAQAELQKAFGIDTSIYADQIGK